MRNKTDSQEMVEIIYRGSTSNHYIVSPNRLVKHYGYGGNGMTLAVFVQDAVSRPDLFEPVSEEGAKAIWPSFPQGAPGKMVEKFTFSEPEKSILPERPVEILADKPVEESDEPAQKDTPVNGQDRKVTVAKGKAAPGKSKTAKRKAPGRR